MVDVSASVIYGIRREHSAMSELSSLRVREISIIGITDLSHLSAVNVEECRCQHTGHFHVRRYCASILSRYYYACDVWLIPPNSSGIDVI